MEFIHIFPLDSPAHTHNTYTKEIDFLSGGKNIKKKTKKERQQLSIECTVMSFTGTEITE